MPAAFISYSIKDQVAAEQLHRLATMAGIDTFLAQISIEPGAKWAQEIFQQLESAQWVFFLATKNSCKSAAVQQELGASIAKKKSIIPLLLDVEVDELPGWVSIHQAIDLRSAPEKLQEKVMQISAQLKLDKFWTGVLVGLIAGFLVYALTKASS